MSAPDLFEPVLGFRAWHPGADGRLIPWSAGKGGTWTPGTNTARCFAGGGHTAPGHRCTCGLYALTDHRDHRLRPSAEAVGAIVAWGDVEAHRTGFRAQFARIVALALPRAPDPHHERALRAAAARYQVPLVALDALEAAGREHGRPLCFDALPDRPRRPAHAPAGTPALDEDGVEGIAHDDHLAVRIGARMLRLALTPALATRLGAGAEIEVPEPGTALRRGDPLVRIADGDHGFVLGAPVSGRVVALGGACGADPGALVCELAPTRWEEEAAAIVWGASAARSYAASLRHAARTGDPFRHVQTEWLSAHSRLRCARDVAEALRAERERPRFASEDEVHARVGGALRAALAQPGVAELTCRAQAVIAWRLHAPDADLVIDLRSPRPQVRCRPPEPDEADIVLYSSAETADDYFAGRADLPAALRRRDVQTRAALASVLRIASVIKALHRPYRAAAG